MFGVYENFPEIRHGIIQFSSTTSTTKLQTAIIRSLYRSNQTGGELNFPEFTQYNIKAALEFGVADGVNFNYVDREILEHCQGRLLKHVFPTLDFLCIVRYYVTKQERRRPLRFDYYMLRFLFHEREIELRVYHERGTRRLPIEDLVRSVMERINQELMRKKLGPLKVNYRHVL